jgi:predicted dehydrogenase
MGQVHARAHARLLQHFPDAPLTPRLVAVADPEPDRQEQAVSAFGFETAVTDYRALLSRGDVAVVSVCGPNFVHREVAVAAAAAGKHLWIEKPAGRDLADTTAIAEAIHAAGVQSAVGFNYRNAPAVEAAHALVAAGEIGDVETVDVYLLSDYAAHPDSVLTWRFDPALAGTGALGDLASHGLDLARHVAGQQTGEICELVADHATFIRKRPEAASAAVPRFSTDAGGARGPVGNEDQASALLRFESGARGRLEASRVAVGEQCKYGFEVRGTMGAVAWDFRRMQELRLCVGQPYLDAAWQTKFVAPGAGELSAFQPGAGVTMGYDDLKVIEAERLVRSIAHGKPVGATIDDAVVAARLVEAIVSSATERRWVSV